MLYFTKQGWELKKKQIQVQEDKIKTLQKEAADAAGVSHDWHDNFGYEDATRQVETESAFLTKLKEELKNGKVIEPEEQNQTVQIGTTVKLSMDNEKKEFTIGAYGETNLESNLISYTSPLAENLVGMEVGQTRTVKIRNKDSVVVVENILPPSHKYYKIIEHE